VYLIFTIILLLFEWVNDVGLNLVKHFVLRFNHLSGGEEVARNLSSLGFKIAKMGFTACLGVFYEKEGF
jgi:hypothetical protein